MHGVDNLVIIATGLDEADVARAFAHGIDFLDGGLAHLGDQIGTEGSGPINQGGTDRRVGRVGVMGPAAGTGLDRHLETQLEQCAHLVRCHRDTGFACMGFFGDPDSHTNLTV